MGEENTRDRQSDRRRPRGRKAYQPQHEKQTERKERG